MNPDIENTSAEIKRYFYEFKRKQYGKPYSPAERFRKPAIWTAAAEKCVELKADPFNFVRASFQFNNVPGGPFPHQLAGVAISKWYRALCRSVGATNDDVDLTEQEVKEVMARGLNLIMSQERRPVDYLLDPYGVRQDVLPAYARVFLFPKNMQILETWGRKATEELNSNPKLVDTVQRMGYSTEFTQNY